MPKLEELNNYTNICRGLRTICILVVGMSYTLYDQ